MEIFVPTHQFEIRYTFILDFPKVIKSLLSPYMRTISKINIKDEGLAREEITLLFEKEFYQIFVSWDRVVFTAEGHPDSFVSNNSIVEDPYFEIVEKLKGLSSFGRIASILVFSTYVKIDPDKDFQSSLQMVKEKYLTSNCQNLFDDTSDLSIKLENTRDDVQTHLTFGPYNGIVDLTKRKIKPSRPDYEKLIQGQGQMAEVKYFEITSSIDFPKYKQIISKSNSLIDKLWNNHS